jgi:hypothetical protein
VKPSIHAGFSCISRSIYGAERQLNLPMSQDVQFKPDKAARCCDVQPINPVSNYNYRARSRQNFFERYL